MDKDVPIFVRIEEYRDVLEVINLIKSNINDAEDLLSQINELKNEEDAEMERWQNSIDAIKRKIQFIDRALFEPEMI